MWFYVITSKGGVVAQWHKRVVEETVVCSITTRGNEIYNVYVFVALLTRQSPVLSSATPDENSTENGKGVF